ncbi:hypothetical protein P3X46_014593 [Hevea brasiliensis]|uniref:Apoptosis-antagonizing transcription factor C-terminal domain-containing protein n=1 Tax=Hevea brasiliensis TaxID=3981 RepID=A0ABQ9LUH0_HEVBR|nr:uncharacterized protein LOC110666919 [Hevea brasiliensis]KAJ9171198.1 hypothetical protein P3X46_014593 [Hevea brasiliensis]
MGSQKQSRKTGGSDLEDFDDLDNGKLMMDEEENYDDYIDNDDDDEEEEEVDEQQGREGEGEGEGEEEEEVEEEEEDKSEGEGDMQNDSHKDAEMEELEKEYMHLRNQEQDILKNLKRHKDEDLLKGQAVKNQKALWDKTLEFRFLLQKAFSSSNRLPQEPVRSSFCDSDGGVSTAYTDLIASSEKTLESLLELQEALLENNPSIYQSSNGNSGKSAKKLPKDSKKSDEESDEEWLRISHMHSRIAPFRDKSIDKWQRKTQVTTGAAAIKSKLQAFNQNISEQVASYMRDPSRMMKQMQQSRSTVSIFGTVSEQLENAKGEAASPDVDPELLDDTEFYQQLLKEFFESIDPTSSEMAFYALKKLQNKKRKIVDRRASKSRKIRYNVHEKIVNFMAPQPMNIPPMAPKLFANLFGLKSHQPASAV